MAKILLVDDDRDLADRLGDWLRLQTYVVEVAYDGKDALQMLRAYQFDVVVLDWDMPEMDGVTVVREYRRGGGLTPIIMLTGNVTIKHKEIGFEAGADDYLTKPFDLRELAARIKGLLRRPPQMLPEEIGVAGIKLVSGKRMLEIDGRELHLKPKEFALLEFLIRHPNTHFSAKALLDAVWPSDADTSEETVRTNIKTLRQQLDAFGRKDFIKTAPKSGYYVEI